MLIDSHLAVNANGRLRATEARTGLIEGRGFVLPDISLSPISFPINHFRAHPVGGASDRLNACARHADGLDPLAGPEVTKLHIS